ncbi:unnamed protein product [Brassica oleracea]
MTPCTLNIFLVSLRRRFKVHTPLFVLLTLEGFPKRRCSAKMEKEIDEPPIKCGC